MGDDQLIAQMCMVILNNKANESGSWGFTESDIDAFYNMGRNSDFNDDDCPYRNIDRLEQILHQWDLVIQAQGVYSPSHMVSAKMLWATLYVCIWAYDNGYTISPNKRKEHFKALKEVDDRLIIEGENLYAQKRIEYVNKNLDPDEVKKSNYYGWWTGVPGHPTKRQKRIDELIKNISPSTRRFHLKKMRSGVNLLAAK